jgi:hypothetical protein
MHAYAAAGRKFNLTVYILHAGGRSSDTYAPHRVGVGVQTARLHPLARRSIDRGHGNVSC